MLKALRVLFQWVSLFWNPKFYQKFCDVGLVESNFDIAVAKSVDAEVVADNRKVILTIIEN